MNWFLKEFIVLTFRFRIFLCWNETTSSKNDFCEKNDKKLKPKINDKLKKVKSNKLSRILILNFLLKESEHFSSFFRKFTASQLEELSSLKNGLFLKLHKIYQRSRLEVVLIEHFLNWNVSKFSRWVTVVAFLLYSLEPGLNC